jgi:hypothetical protein
MVNFVGLDIVDDVYELPAVGQITIMQKHAGPGSVWIDINIVETSSVERGCPADNTVDLIPF